jgi:hypothetical protein
MRCHYCKLDSDALVVVPTEDKAHLETHAAQKARLLGTCFSDAHHAVMVQVARKDLV